MYTVVGHPNSRAIRALWALEEMKLDYTLQIAFPGSEAVEQVNPSRKVPVLLDGDFAIPDSVAIITYLADKHGQLTYPAGTQDRATQDSLTQFTVDEIEGPLWLAARHSFVLPEDKRVAGVKATAQWEFARSCEVLKKRMSDGPFLMGDKMTIADIIAGHSAGWAKNAGFDWPDGPVGDYFERMQANETLATARAKGKAALDAAG